MDQRMDQLDDEIKLIDCLKVIWKWKKLIILGTIVIIIVAGVISFLMPKVYSIQMVLEPGILKVSEDGQNIYAESQENIKALIETGVFDRDILKLISNNAKMPLLEIANKLKTSHQVIRNHINKLEKLEVIKGYRASIDIIFLGYRYYKAYVNFLNINRLNEFEFFCEINPNILNINRSIGGTDFEIEMQVKNFEEFQDIMNDLRTNFEGMIDDYEFVIAREEKKMTYFPFG